MSESFNPDRTYNSGRNAKGKQLKIESDFTIAEDCLLEEHVLSKLESSTKSAKEDDKIKQLKTPRAFDW